MNDRIILGMLLLQILVLCTPATILLWLAARAERSGTTTKWDGTELTIQSNSGHSYPRAAA